MPGPRQVALLETARASRRLARTAGTAAALGVALLLSASPGQAAMTGSGPRLDVKSATATPQGALDLCRRYSWACARGRSARLSARQIRTVRNVNRSINARVHQIADIVQYRLKDYWTLPTARGGDCEDIALLKKEELIRRGIPPGRLLLATVLDRQRNNHAVLVLRTERGDFVLDNLSNRMLPWTETRYSFLKMQNPAAPSHWVAVLEGGIFNG